MSTQREIIENSDGSFSEKIIQRVCKVCGRIELRCKCVKPEIEVVETLRAFVPPVKPTDAPGMSEAERLQIISDKFKAKEDKKSRQEENMRIAAMTDEELAEEEKTAEDKSRMEREIIERNQAAIKNVEKMRLMKEKMMAEGKDRNEIKKAVREFKTNILDTASEDSEEEQLKLKNPKGAGRPRKDALTNPKKDPKTGEFYSAEEKE